MRPGVQGSFTLDVDHGEQRVGTRFQRRLELEGHRRELVQDAVAVVQLDGGDLSRRLHFDANGQRAGLMSAERLAVAEAGRFRERDGLGALDEGAPNGGIGEQGSPVIDAKLGNIDCRHLTGAQQRRQIDLLQAMNNDLLERSQVDPALEGVINSFELGFRMQSALPKALDVSKESPKTLEMYGISAKGARQAANGKAGGAGAATDDFGRQCLMARRLAEAGVRFVEVCLGNWDTHNGLKNRLTGLCGSIDQPMGALLADLKQRDMLKDTLVIWGGEFGRTPSGQGTDGRDHNSAGFSMWLAGGGTKGGQRVGATDETGARAVENKCHHHDLHATVLHLMGLDHQKLAYRYGGRDYTLTDIHGRVVKEVLA